jgi:extradiol dioxygenase family protein
MLTDNNPKLPVRDKDVTREFYINKLGFKEFDPKENYEQVYI